MIAIVTCKDFPELAPEDQGWARAMNALGLKFKPVIWNDPRVDWKSFSRIIVRSPWGYYTEPVRFREWIKSLRGLDVQNPVSVLEWNLSKLYLKELESRGVPIVPTIWLEASKDQSLRNAMARMPGESEWILKPSISAGAYESFRLKTDDAAKFEAKLMELLQVGPALLQPYLREIETDGEISLIYFKGRFSHAVVKRPKSGDFRIHEKFGGSTELHTPSLDEFLIAEKCLQATPEPTLYARVDLIRARGAVYLGELEVLEPSLFFKAKPEAAKTFAHAIT